jgi:hypothetical protein
MSARTELDEQEQTMNMLKEMIDNTIASYPGPVFLPFAAEKFKQEEIEKWEGQEGENFKTSLREEIMNDDLRNILNPNTSSRFGAISVSAQRLKNTIFGKGWTTEEQELTDIQNQTKELDRKWKQRQSDLKTYIDEEVEKEYNKVLENLVAQPVEILPPPPNNDDELPPPPDDDLATLGGSPASPIPGQNGDQPSSAAPVPPAPPASPPPKAANGGKGDSPMSMMEQILKKQKQKQQKTEEQIAQEEEERKKETDKKMKELEQKEKNDKAKEYGKKKEKKDDMEKQVEDLLDDPEVSKLFQACKNHAIKQAKDNKAVKSNRQRVEFIKKCVREWLVDMNAIAAAQNKEQYSVDTSQEPWSKLYSLYEELLIAQKELDNAPKPDLLEGLMGHLGNAATKVEELNIFPVEVDSPEWERISAKCKEDQWDDFGCTYEKYAANPEAFGMWLDKEGTLIDKLDLQ